MLWYKYLFYRCETFNGVMREHNLHGNRQASSRDITTNFAIIEQLLYVCKGGVDQTGKTLSVRATNKPLSSFAQC